MDNKQIEWIEWAAGHSVWEGDRNSMTCWKWWLLVYVCPCVCAFALVHFTSWTHESIKGKRLLRSNRKIIFTHSINTYYATKIELIPVSLTRSSVSQQSLSHIALVHSQNSNTHPMAMHTKHTTIISSIIFLSHVVQSNQNHTNGNFGVEVCTTYKYTPSLVSCYCCCCCDVHTHNRKNAKWGTENRIKK